MQQNTGSHKLLAYLAEMIVNGPNHPGAEGAPPAKVLPPPPSLPASAALTIGAAAPLTGWRDVLVSEGPEAWSKAIREHRKTQGVLITDTTWRDAHQVGLLKFM